MASKLVLISVALIVVGHLASVNCHSLVTYHKLRTFYDQLNWPGKQRVTSQLVDGLQVTFDRISSNCSRGLISYASALKSGEKWAYQMLDSAAKFKPGFLYGELSDFGHYDQCSRVHVHEDQFKGRLFLVRNHWPLVGNLTAALEAQFTGQWLNNLVKVNQFLKMETLVTAACLPSTCSAHELELIFTNSTLSKFDLASFDRDTKYAHVTTFNSLALYTFISLIAMVIASTYLINAQPSLASNDVIKAFDLVANSKEILRFSSNPAANQFNYISGTRIIYTVMTFYSHFTFNVFFATPTLFATYPQHVSNSSKLNQNLEEVLATYVGINFVMGGMLNYYSSHLKMKNPLKSPTFWNYTLNRVLRTLPVIMAVLLLTLGFPTGHGPVYDIGRSNITGNCINKGWYEFTFSTASLVEFPYVCVPHAWYIGVDLRFYMLSFFLVPLTISRPKIGVTILVSLIPLGIFLQAAVIYAYDIPGVLGANTADLMNWSNVSYLLHSGLINYISSYAVGLFVGYLIANQVTVKSEFKQWLLLLLLTVLFLLAFAMPMMFDRTVRWQDIVLGSTLRTAISMSFAGLIYMGWIDNCTRLAANFLSARIFQVMGKLSYSTFMVHICVIWYENMNMRHAMDYSSLALLCRWIHTLVMSFGVGYILHVLVEAPFSKLVRKVVK